MGFFKKNCGQCGKTIEGEPLKVSEGYFCSDACLEKHREDNRSTQRSGGGGGC